MPKIAPRSPGYDPATSERKCAASHNLKRILSRARIRFLLVAAATILAWTTDRRRGHNSSITGYETAARLLPSNEVMTLPPSCDPLDDPAEPFVTKYGRDVLYLARAYEGSGTRVRKLLRMLIAGQAIKVGVLGGSVTRGHGLHAHGTGSSYHEQLFAWINATFPPGRGQQSVLVNGAVAGTNVEYFSFCFQEHIPVDVDLVILEFDINSWRHDSDLVSIDALLRSLLESRPNLAVLYVSVFGIQNGDLASGFPAMLSTMQYFDVPVVSVRHMGLPLLNERADKTAEEVLFQQMLSPSKDMDHNHINFRAHTALADSLVLYLRKQLCEVRRRDARPDVWEQAYPPIWPHALGNVPRLRLIDRWSQDARPSMLWPRCLTVQSAASPLRPLRSSGFVSIVVNEKHFLATNVSGSTISFELKDVMEGSAGMLYWSTPDTTFGSLRCGIDGLPETERTIAGFQQGGMPWTKYSGKLWERLVPGRHSVECTSDTSTVGGSAFRIVGIVYR